jgi:hypothetical protein
LNAKKLGCGGAGKTTIARKYLYADNYNFAYEINAESAVSVSSALKNLAYSLAETADLREVLKYILCIPGTKEREKQLIIFIKSGLQKAGNWCLLFDNVEDFEVLKRFCPINGNVIITTRNRDIQNVSYPGKMSHIMVNELTDEEKEKLFCVAVGNENRWKKEEIRRFLKQLPSFPLDVSAAAYYLKNIDITLSEYENLLKVSRKGFLNWNKDFMLRYNDYDKTRYGIVTSTLKSIDRAKHRI